MTKTLYIGTFVHSKSLKELDVCEQGIIGVDEGGKIVLIKRDTTAIPENAGWHSAKRIYTGEHGFFFPGFIDTHIHASQYPNAGVFGRSTLLDWLNKYTFPLESSFADLNVAYKVYNRVVARTLSHGTTTACYYATIHVPATNLLADICKSRGQRAFVGRVCMDALSPDYYRDESPADAYAASKACIDHVKQIDPNFNLITPIITPRFAPSCKAPTLHAMGQLHAETGVPIQTHISENKQEIELVRKLFPDCKSYAHVYDSHRLLTKKTILAHAVHLTPEERALIKQRGSKISHCPASNTALTSGRAKVRELLNAGMTVGLGTDVSGGYTPSMLAEAREAIFNSRHVAMDDGDDAKLTVDEVLYLATRGGAQVVGLENKIGGFELGMDFDAQLIDLSKVEGDMEESDGLVEIFGGESWADRLAKWLYTGDDRNTIAVWIAGRLVHSRQVFAAPSKFHSLDVS